MALSFFMLKFRLFFSCYGPSETVTVTVSQHVNRKSGSNYLGPFLELTSCTHQSANCSEVATVGRLRVNVPTVRTRRKRSPVTRHTLCPLAASLFLVLLLQVLALHSSHNAILHSAVSILLGCCLCTLSCCFYRRLEQDFTVAEQAHHSLHHHRPHHDFLLNRHQLHRCSPFISIHLSRCQTK